MSRTDFSGPSGTTRPDRANPSGRSVLTGRNLLLVVCVGLLVLLGGAFVLGGTEALAGAAVGMALVSAFLITGRLPFLVDPERAPGLSYLVLGINYLFRVVLLLVALVALKDQPWLDARALGVVVIAGALVWNALSLRKHLIAARNSPGPDVNSDETLTGSDESIPSDDRTGGGSR